MENEQAVSECLRNGLFVYAVTSVKPQVVSAAEVPPRVRFRVVFKVAYPYAGFPEISHGLNLLNPFNPWLIRSVAGDVRGVFSRLDSRPRSESYVHPA